MRIRYRRYNRNKLSTEPVMGNGNPLAKSHTISRNSHVGQQVEYRGRVRLGMACWQVIGLKVFTGSVHAVRSCSGVEISAWGRECRHVRGGPHGAVERPFHRPPISNNRLGQWKQITTGTKGNAGNVVSRQYNVDGSVVKAGTSLGRGNTVAYRERPRSDNGFTNVNHWRRAS